MKTKLSKQVIALLFAIPAAVMSQDANLILDGFNSFYNAYDNNTKKITGIAVEVGADGNNSNNYIASDFEVSLYLLTCDASGSTTSSTPIIIATYTVFGGSLHQMGTYTFSNQTVDLSQVSGLADGMYRMGAWVNSNAGGNGIGDPPDYQSDNAGLLMSSGGTSSSSVINFTSANGVQTFAAVKNVACYPVPASSSVNIQIESNGEGSANISLWNLSGKIAREQKVNLVTGNNDIHMNVADLAGGIYIVRITTASGIISKRISINR